MNRRSGLVLLSGIVAGCLSMATVSFAEVPDGAIIFERNCSVCHSINPPPKTAPPIAPMANRYHQRFQTKGEGVAHLMAFLKKPDKQKSIDQQAIARFGLMPAISLPDAELRAVAEWFWNQSNPAYGSGGGRGQGRFNR
jgi:mono/diheme cytochrome c family protein